MNTHKNAKLTASGREEMIRRVGEKSTAIARAGFGVSLRTARKWMSRHRQGGFEEFAYTPDFVRLAESYGAKGIRVSHAAEADAAWQAARANNAAPTVIERLIAPELIVLPVVPPGCSLEQTILD